MTICCHIMNVIVYVSSEEEEKMTFDYKKEYKEFYMPKSKPNIVEVPKMNYANIHK